MSLKHKPELILPHLIENLVSACQYAQMIQMEYNDNGMDSLANIDYGAALNAELIKIQNQFNMLDEVGMFTMGQE